MSPRPAASRTDASARTFLDSAAALIDAAMTDSENVPPRLRAIKFPASLEWIRIEDVLRLAGQAPGASKKAFRQRWETRDEFITDAAVYALQFADRPSDEYRPLTDRLAGLEQTRLGDEVASLAGDLLRYAESSPRSYLMLHIGSVLHRHPTLQQAFAANWRTLRQPFVAGYVAVLDRLSLTLRPGWTPASFDRALHAMVDGFLLQGRIHPDAPQLGTDETVTGAADTWSHVSLFAETVVAFTLGALDTEGGGLDARAALSLRAAAASGQAS
ncbi:hypothetical protein [uncultured Friedmanniella sp.]|uniref:hypothetical protein n=1 Tax=uncultured Friedmanniella sp. TaxID=335381 RepID=UPI0035CB2A9E